MRRKRGIDATPDGVLTVMTGVNGKRQYDCSTKTASTAAGLIECWKVRDQVPESSGMPGEAKVLQNYACIMHVCT